MFCPPCQPEPCAQPYQPLPISTGACGLDRCGNVVAYAAPSVVQAPVGWGCWPIQFQGGWLYQGPFSAVGSAGVTGQLNQLMTQGAAMANWMISQRSAAHAR